VPAEDKTASDVLQVQGRMTLGYGIIPKLVMQDQRLTIEAKAIYSYFCSFAGAGTTAFPSRSKILYDLKISEDRYYRHFNLLKKCGYILVEQKSDASGKFKRNIYTLVEMLPLEPTTPTSPDEPLPPYPQNKGTEPYPYYPGTDEPDTENKGIKNNSLNINNSIINKSSQSQRQTTPEERPDMTPTLDDEIIEPVKMDKKKMASANLPIQPYRQAEAARFSQDDYTTYRQIIQENIEYDAIASGNRDRELIDGLIQVMLDVMLTESPATVKIGKETKSIEIVKAVYLKLTSQHIEHVVEQYKAQHHQITHKTAYLRTMLYTVYQEFEAHFTNQVRADGVVW
jgi:hypothetical protein